MEIRPPANSTSVNRPYQNRSMNSYRRSCSRSRRRSQSYVRLTVSDRSTTHPVTALDTYQASPLATPTTLMGVQVRPTRALTSCTSTPIALRMGAAAALPALWTDSQHWMAPVAHPAGLELGAGVAAARIARAEMVKSLVNMVNAMESCLQVRQLVRLVSGRVWEE